MPLARSTSKQSLARSRFEADGVRQPAHFTLLRPRVLDARSVARSLAAAGPQPRVEPWVDLAGVAPVDALPVFVRQLGRLDIAPGVVPGEAAVGVAAADCAE